MLNRCLLWGLLMVGPAVLAGPGCARRPRSPAEQTLPARSPDSVPERLGSLPGVDKESDPENLERRYGIGAARAQKERRRQEEEARRKRAGVVEAQDERPAAVPAAEPGDENP